MIKATRFIHAVSNQPIRSLYLFGLVFISCGLAWSNAMMSIGQMLLGLSWILSGNFAEKWKNLKQNKTLILHFSFFLFLIIGLLWTDDMSYGMKDINVKLPLFILPFMIGTQPPLQKSEWKVILTAYISTLFILSFFSLTKLLSWFDYQVVDKRELSIRISHIRYGLNFAIAIILMIRFNFLYHFNAKILLVLISAWFVLCILLFQLYTALFGLIIALFAYSLYLIFKSNNRLLSIALVVINSAFIFLLYHLGLRVYVDYYSKITPDYDQEILAKASEAGNPYYHNENSNLKENGVYLWRYFQKEELYREWNKRSSVPLTSADKKGNNLEHTLVRYLSSKGLRKDSVGLAQLSDDEIKAVENGIANQYYLTHNKIENRVHKIIYELDQYSKSGFADGYSLAMRLEYWKTGWHIIKDNWILGVGTGDVRSAFDLQYELDQSSLSENYRLRAHNQYLTIWIGLGVVGLILFLVYLFYPLFRQYHYKVAFYLVSLILLLSFLTEDTLETQAGATLFAFFNSLFVFGLNQDRAS